MYIQETYKNLMYYKPFNELYVLYDNDKDMSYMGVMSFSKYKYSLKNWLDCPDWTVKNFDKETKKYITSYKKTSKRFSMHCINLQVKTEVFGHAIIALHDSKTNELEFFQRDVSMFEISQEYKKSQKLLKDFFKYIYGDTVKFKFQEQLCIITSKFVNECKIKNYELYKRVEGDCMIWMLWYLELRLKNHNFSRGQVLSKVIKYFKNDIRRFRPDGHYACKVILGYSTFIDNFNKQFDIIKTEKGDFIKINKRKSTPLLKKAERLMKMYLFYLRDFVREHRLIKL
jgi:AraC-like DNA-binding protein